MRCATVLEAVCCSLCWVGCGLNAHLPELPEADRARLDVLKKEMDFAKWRSRYRHGRQIVAMGLNAEHLVPADIQCTADKRLERVPMYRVKCSRRGEDGRLEEIVLSVRLCESLEDARELLLRHFLYVEAPVPYLKKLWAKYEVPYGDVSFGPDLWGTGNLVFEITSGRRHSQFVRYVCRSIDKALTTLPEARKTLPEGMELQVDVADTEDKWTVRLTKIPEDQQVLLSLRGLDGKVVGERQLRIAGKVDFEQRVHLVLVRRGDEARAYEIILPRRSGPKGGQPVAIESGKSEPARRKR